MPGGRRHAERAILEGTLRSDGDDAAGGPEVVRGRPIALRVVQEFPTLAQDIDRPRVVPFLVRIVSDGHAGQHHGGRAHPIVGEHLDEWDPRWIAGNDVGLSKVVLAGIGWVRPFAVLDGHGRAVQEAKPGERLPCLRRVLVLLDSVEEFYVRSADLVKSAFTFVVEKKIGLPSRGCQFPVGSQIFAGKAERFPCAVVDFLDRSSRDHPVSEQIDTACSTA